MDHQILEQYIESYKHNFSRIHSEEIYKWKSVKTFLKNWNSESFVDFHEKMAECLRSSYNLLTSGQYFPKAILLQVCEKEPRKVEEMFNNLFNEDKYYISRIESFQSSFQRLCKKLYPEYKNHYQDHRAIMVYLSSRFPEKYYLYKYTMFEYFAKKIGMSYKPTRGKIENVSQFMTTCELVNQVVSKDSDLVEMHFERLRNEMYYDEGLNILTQDLIYAISKHLEVAKNKAKIKKTYRFEQFKMSEFTNKEKQKTFKGRLNIDYAKREARNRRIGFAGEMYIMKLEKDKLSRFNLVPVHSSIVEGDGVGYDIKSFDERGDDKYIEVKTTTGSLETPFYITSNELERSKELCNKYSLYRVYNFSYETGTGDVACFTGSLEKLCSIPEVFHIHLARKE